MEPVPPLATVRAVGKVKLLTVAFTAKRLVVEATDAKRLVVVAEVKSALTKCDVDDACNPAVNQMGVEVEFARAP